MMVQVQKELTPAEIARNVSKSIARLIVYIVLYVAVSAFVKYLIADFLPRFGMSLGEYEVYVQILLALAFGFLIASAVASFFYWSTVGKYGHPTAAAIRNVVRFVGIGGMLAAIAGGVAGGAAGVALGGFIGMVIGFASQQVLGQTIAGLFLLIARPFKIGDSVIVAGEEGVVEDVTTLFTVIAKADGTKVLIPSNTIIGGKIILKPRQQ